MAAVASSSTAMAAIEKSQAAKDAIAASDMATAKYAVGAAGLKPADYANMAAVAAFSPDRYGGDDREQYCAQRCGSSSAAASAVRLRALSAAASSTAMTAVASFKQAAQLSRTMPDGKERPYLQPFENNRDKGQRKRLGEPYHPQWHGICYISCFNANSGGEAESTWYKLDGEQTSQPAGTTNVGKFFTSSWQFTGGLLPPASTYIPC